MRRGSQILATLVGLQVVSSATRALAESPPAGEPPPPANAKPEDQPSFSARLGMSIGSAIPSAHEDLLSDEGYSGPRYAFHLRGTGAIAPRVSIGAYVKYGFRNISSDTPGPVLDVTPPDYVEEVVVLAATADVGLYRGKTAVLTFEPMLGMANSKVSLHGDGESQWSPAFGAAISLYFPKVYLGVSGGFDWIRTEAPGDVAEPNNLGAIYMALNVGFDVE